MEWLPNWSNRIKFTVDNSKIQTVLYDFPVLVKLDTTYSGVFNTLGSNSKRMCFITSDTYDYCYCEVAYWEAAANTAQLWVKLPTVVASGTGVTEFYMYYDNTQSDHFYIGNTGETSAKSVWDSNFSAVYHMVQDPSIGGACILDSTSNVKHGTPTGMNSADLVNGLIGKTLSFSNNKYISIPISTLLSNQPFTLEKVIKTTGNAIAFIRGAAGESLATNILRFRVWNNSANFWYETGAGTNQDNSITIPLTALDNQHHYFADSVASTTWTFYSEVGVYTKSLSAVPDSTAPIYINWNGVDEWGSGVYSELRISKIVRGESWCTATRYSNFDTLLTKGGIENNSQGSFGEIYQNKILITIPKGAVEETVTDFPVLINISSESGLNKVDISKIFDELSLASDYSKVAITDFTQTIRYCAEVENWDPLKRSAQIWVRVPEISSIADTRMYIHYNKNIVDNFELTGATGSLAAGNVWDSDFVGIYHMAQRPAENSVVKNSTLFKLNGTFHGTADIDTTNIGNFVSLARSGWLEINSVASYTTGSFTWEVMYRADTTASGQSYALICGNASSTGNNTFLTSVQNPSSTGNKLTFGYSDPTTNYYYTGTHDSNTVRSFSLSLNSLTNSIFMRINGEDISPNTEPSFLSTASITNRISSTDLISVGQEYDGVGVVSDLFSGLIREVRVSKTFRSEAWLKVTSKSNLDELLIYDIEKEVKWLKTYENGELSPWSNRIPIEVDYTKIEAPLNDFPVLLNLTDSSGINNYDLSSFFNYMNYTVVGDDFTGENGSIPNSLIWVQTAQTEQYINANKLYCYVATALTSGPATEALFNIKGDFDIQVDITNISAPATNNWYERLRVVSKNNNEIWGSIAIAYAANIRGFHFRYDDYGTNDGEHIVANTSDNVTLRIVREANILSAYYYSVDMWVQIGSSHTWSFDNVRIMLDSYKSFTTNSLTFTHDNFIINSGTIIWTTEKYPFRKKIAITSEDGETQLPVEIENWDHENKSIQLWTKISNIIYSQNTKLYLYFDTTKKDNTDYIGTTVEYQASYVWDSDFLAVYHLSQNPSVGGACISDSTNNRKHGTPYGGMLDTNVVDSVVGKCLAFDGVNDYINIPLNVAIPIITIEALHYRITGHDNNDMVISKYNYGNTADSDIQIYISTDIETHILTVVEAPHMANIDNTWYNSVITYDKTIFKYYNNGSIIENVDSNNVMTSASAEPWIIGADADSTNAGSLGNYFKGNIKEIRISKTVRSDSWIKTTYYSNFDNLLLYYPNETYTEPIPEEYFFHGYIKELSQPVARKVSLYNKATGNLIDTTMSDPYTGYYLLASYTNDEHFIVAFDDEYGTAYNPLIRDNFLPNGK